MNDTAVSLVCHRDADAAVGVLLVAVELLHLAAAIDVGSAVVAANTYIGGIPKPHGRSTQSSASTQTAAI